MLSELRNLIWSKVVGWLIAIPEANRNLSAINNPKRLLEALRPADVILFEGRTRVGDIIKLITLSPWIHSALYVGRLNEIRDSATRKRIRKFYKGDPNEQLVIESLLGYGTVVRPMSDYMEDNLRICRPAHIRPKDRQRVVCFAAEHLGLSYDVRQLLDLARFFFPYGLLPRHWRSTLFQHNAGKPTHVVCSGMIARCFQSVDYPILPVVVTDNNEYKRIYKRNFRLYVPADFDYSPYFEIVKFPDLDLSHGHSHRYLPWDTAEENDELPLIADRPDPRPSSRTVLEGGSS